jgi:capsular exopolysaccharide synthesis family protein
MSTNPVFLENASGEKNLFVTICFRYLRFWKVFILSIIFCLAVAFIYLKYATREYSVYAKVLVNNSGRSQNAGIFDDLGIKLPANSFENEIVIINSETLKKEVLDSLKLSIPHSTLGLNVVPSPNGKSSNIVHICMNTSDPSTGVKIINTLIGIYNQRTIEEKNYVATRTISFIDERLITITRELKDAEKNVERYKRYQGITDIKAESQLFLSASNEYSKRIAEVETQLILLESIQSFLMSSESDDDIAPANVGLTDPTVLLLMHKYNDEILTKKRLTNGMTPDNPVLKELDAHIVLLKDNLLKGIGIAQTSMQTTIQGLRQQENAYRKKNRTLSSQEREWDELYRQKAIKENLFIYLLQKSEDTSLSLAMATPGLDVVDPPVIDPDPVKPEKKTILLMALCVGLIIPAGVVYLKDLFDNKLRDKEQVIRAVKAPFLGTVSINKTNETFPVLNLRSRIAEDFRVIVAHLSFVIPGGDRSRIVVVTSSFGGEGKSFFSRNLAMSLATLGKKTLLIDLDMRKSVLNKTLELNPNRGVAMFLADKDLEISQIIDRTVSFHKNLDIIPLKIYPPNPEELLGSNRLDVLFQTVGEMYDYVIVDTAPVGLVADAFLIDRFADATIYVARMNYTYKASLPEIQDLYRNRKLHNLCTVLNATPLLKQYGYGNYYVDSNS